MPVGRKRARRIDPQLRQAIGAEVGQDTMGRSGGAFARSLARARMWPCRRIGDAFANNAMAVRVQSYVTDMAAVFSVQRTSVISMALDGTRMNGKDTLYAAMFSPEFGKRIKP